jgi:HSP20 family molecular chaperone IbpA
MTNKSLIDKFFSEFNTVGSHNPFLNAFDNGSYPPYNIIKTADGYLIEVSVPGWTKEDLEVTFENRVLKLKAQKRELEEDTKAEYIYKSLSTKAFSRSWVVSDELDVESVFLENGLLNIELIKAEPQKPNLLTIQ